MQTAINTFLGIIKWPLALLMVLFIVPSFMSILEIVTHSLTTEVILWFGLPFLLMGAAWLFVPSMGGSFLAIMEHELTHMVFALLTFHRPVDLDVKQNKGGHFSFQGKGNWLIALAPYFFPTFAVCVMLASFVYFFMGQPLPLVYWSVFGIMVGYHLAATILQIHPGQTDFKQAGYLFTVLFLPGANLIVYGLLFAYACIGWPGIPFYFKLLAYQTGLFVDKIF